MAVKTQFLSVDFISILEDYDLGAFVRAVPISQGTVQINYHVHTSRGRFVFRYYENRSLESVSFESQLLSYLKSQGYPCPGPIKNKDGDFIGITQGKPFILFEFIDGEPLDQPKEHHKLQLIEAAAELQRLTMGYRPRHTAKRWNYDPALSRALALEEAEKLGTDNASKKFAWLEDQLSALALPEGIPKGICHCDFHFSNVLFKDDQLVGLIDFDDANYTYLGFDLVGLIEAWAWPHRSDGLNFEKARWIVESYEGRRPLNPIERYHLYDVHKLSIFFDTIWYFGRGCANDFFEKRKIDFLDKLGRERYERELFQIIPG